MIEDVIKSLDIEIGRYLGDDIIVNSPIDGKEIGSVKFDNEAVVNDKISKSKRAFEFWRDVPAPKRGELIRIFGNILREHKNDLGKLVTIECGKILQEGLGEVQEMIDICDFAVGLSRQIGGLTLPSERNLHNMEENWLPLGPVGVISAFNFPVAVWSWNFALAVVCGDSVLWKPSEKTPFTAIACNELFNKAIKIYLEQEDFNKEQIQKIYNLNQLIIGDADIGDILVNHKDVPLISATGSTKMGSIVAPKVAKRFGKCLLELGGNNAVIVSDKADLEVAMPSILFGAVGTCGQRCTSTRRAFIHESIYDVVFSKLKEIYQTIDSKVGNPLKEGTLIGPLIDADSFDNMQNSLQRAKSQASEIIGGNRIEINEYQDGYYVKPALVKMDKQYEIVKKETFAPILYLMPYSDLNDAIEMQNDVPQGLSSAIFTTDLKEAAIFKKYSDCGITNVNIGTSGAEIGGAFGGEKETGGGRESGSDSWKIYMRRQTSTTYYGDLAPQLAQGIKFE
jgi:aldehyde dehydrogenase (NAD+)